MVSFIQKKYLLKLHSIFGETLQIQLGIGFAFQSFINKKFKYKKLVEFFISKGY